MELKWTCKHFTALTPGELHQILRLRIDVFVVEQNCAYAELDGKDTDAWHVFAIDETGECIACARLLKPGVSYPVASIGRVVTATKARGTGLGHELMGRSIQHLNDLTGCNSIKISAQAHLQKFYSVHGFVTVTEEYMEDGIPHVGMVRNG